MIHFKENCDCTVKFKNTEICSICANHDHHDFVRAKNLSIPAKNELYQKVLDGLKNGRQWRVQKKPNTECGHPGVRNTGGKCVFCMTEKRMNKPADPSTEAEAIRKNITMIEQNIGILNEELQTMHNALNLCEMGLPVGVLKIKSPRQQAIADGKRWYMPYNPCKHCHVVAERYVANGKCRNCGK